MAKAEFVLFTTKEILNFELEEAKERFKLETARGRGRTTGVREWIGSLRSAQSERTANNSPNGRI